MPSKALSIAVIAAWIAHILAWAASAWLAFGPISQGVSYSGLDESSSTLNPEEWTHYTETLIEANGLGAVWVIAVPILLTGIVVWTLHRTDSAKLWRKVLIWVFVLTLVGLSIMTLLSVGSLYVPAALALLIAAVANSIAKDAAQQ